jgi:hypothetical protein
MKRKPSTKDDPLADYAVYLREIQAKPIEHRKPLWTAMVAREGLLIAEYIGARLEIDEMMVSQWIRELIAARVQRTFLTTVPAEFSEAMAVLELEPS